MTLDTKIKVLVVDDSGTMRIMIKRNLQKTGYTTFVEAKDGQDAIEKLEAQDDIRLIISDWNMPRKDGLELLKWVRSQEKFKNVNFIMATAQGDKTQQLIAKDEGANGHIAKPFTAEQLKETIIKSYSGESKEKPVERKRRYTDGKVHLKIGHIQITDHLALGILRHQIETGAVSPKYFELETVRMPGWNPIQTHLENNEIDAAFVLAPIAMDLYAYKVPIKLVSFAHKNGSIFARTTKTTIDDYGSIESFYKYKVIDIPHKMSIHNMLAHKFLREMGLRPGVPGQKKPINVRFEVVPPIQMPKIMKENEGVAGFIVAEPIGSNAISKGIAEKQFLSSEIWKDHPCCIVAFRDEVIEEHEDAVYEFVSLLHKAGKMAQNDIDQASEIAVNFLDPEKRLGLTTDVLKRVLSDPMGITMNDLYPVLDDLDKIQRYMHDEMDIGVLIDVDKFVDLRFSDEAVKNSN